ncbi:MAG TPA: hypothetical protein VHV32_00935 [Candidatus Angelobacter sp.]|nr:hypothetical protein [Candidatus Angelobacter sp.]
MMNDGYAQWYADRLWQLLPAIYRTLDERPAPGAEPDAGDSGPLRELVNRIGNQAAILRRNIDRLRENQSIETCDDWVIPYIGDLIATRLVSCLDAASQRVDVAKTIYYRRRAGTVSVLEELADDIALRDARVVEFFRHMGRTRHQFDPPLSYQIENPVTGPVGFIIMPGSANVLGAWNPAMNYNPNDEVTFKDASYLALVANNNKRPNLYPATWNLLPSPDALEITEGLIGAYSGTPVGGFADLRNTYAAGNTGTAFDEYAYTADLRQGSQTLGWYNIRHLGVFLWWLQAFPISAATPVSSGKTPPCFTFDPTGRDIPLFNPSRRANASSAKRSVWGEDWISPDEWDLAVAIRETLWQTAPTELYPQAFWVGLTAAGSSAPVPPDSVSIHPERGRFSFIGAVPQGAITGSYSFGLLSAIGAGGYDDSILNKLDQPVFSTSVSGGSGLDAALAAVGKDQVVEIADSLTYAGPSQTLAVPQGRSVWVRAASGERPVLRSTAATPPSWIITGSAGTGGSKTVLVLQGILLQGSDLVLQGSFDTVYLRMVTLDPGTASATAGQFFGTAIDGLPLRPSNLFIDGTITKLVLERCVTGPIRSRSRGAIEELTASDSVIQCIPTHTVAAGKPAHPPLIIDPAALAASLKNQSTPLGKSLLQKNPSLATDLKSYVVGTAPSPALIKKMANALGQFSQVQEEATWPLALADLALGFSAGKVALSRCTVMGPTHTHRFEASECILDDVAAVEDPQHGCVRFTAYAAGSTLHQPYRSVQVAPRASLFQTRAFGQPEYARLRSDADSRILTPTTGGNGCDMGAQTIPGSILAGAQNGSEMGVYCLEAVALKRRGLALKFEEYAPLGQLPVWIDVD